MAGEDRAYTAWVREQPCAVQPCGGGVREIHHATKASRTTREGDTRAKFLSQLTRRAA